MLNLLSKLVRLISFVLAILLMTSVCFAENSKNNVDFQPVIANIKNKSADLILNYDIDNIELVKILRDAHYATIPYAVDLTTIKQTEKFYIDLQRSIADLQGNFSSFSKKQIADMVLLSTSFANDSECISGYSVLNALLGDENINKIKKEGIKSVCTALSALTCHEKYKQLSQAEQKQLLEIILNYDYDNISDIVCALIAIDTADISSMKVQEWKNGILNKVVDLYKNNEYDIQQIANIATSALILDIDVDYDDRFIKEGQTIINVLNERIKNTTIKNKECIKSLLTSLVYYETKQNPYYYGNYHLRQNHNKITTEIYQYLFNQSDITNHWAKNDMIDSILNGFISYNYSVEKNIFPNQPITRGEFISLIVKSQNIENSSEIVFSDITNSNYKNEISAFVEKYIAKKFISQSEKNTFLNLYFGDNFRPDDVITREEAAFFIQCASGYANKILTDSTENLEVFTDYKDCDEKYINMLEFCSQRGFISGRNGKLLPKEALTRAEAVTLMSKLLRYC